MRYPDRLYETPAGWGIEVYWLSWRRLTEAIRELNKVWGSNRARAEAARVWRHIGAGIYEAEAGGDEVYRGRFVWDHATESWRPLWLERVDERTGDAERIWVRA